MAKLITLTPNKTYATEANALKAVEKIFPASGEFDRVTHLTYFLQRTNEGRFFPVFIGQPAIEAMAFHYFNVVA